MTKFLAGVVFCFVCLLILGHCQDDSKAERLLRYNACSNAYMLEAARKVGAPTDTPPSSEQIERVRAEVDRECGYLK